MRHTDHVGSSAHVIESEIVEDQALHNGLSSRLCQTQERLQLIMSLDAKGFNVGDVASKLLDAL
jgi:hypothetical protein